MRLSAGLLPLGLITLVVLAWFWPMTLLGRRPVGEDIYGLYLPLMSYYGGALRQGRIPLWNEQWNFGVPGLAESQMGVFYPPHLLLYRLLGAADAHALSLVFHFLLAAWFAYWCARGFELSRWAAVLAALVFTGQGFFICQMPCQWSYTTGAWLPLAVLAVWRWLQGAGCHWLFGLVMVLALQFLAGHFQIAFYTHVVLLAVGVGTLVLERGRRVVMMRRGLLIPMAMMGALAVAAVQLLPTSELAAGADRRGRGFDYLASFANPPAHLINYVAPTLLHRHPLWEPIAWTPWRTSPKECLSYVGLVPLCLVLAAIRVCRREGKVRLWLVLLLMSLAFSFGPYMPGFRWLLALPGFNWFPAPARWSIVSGLFLGLLAGRGLERIDPTSFRRWCCWFAVVAVVALALAAAGLVTAANARLGVWADRTWQVLSPWPEPTWSAWSRRPPDFRLSLRLLTHGYSEASLENITPAKELGRMLREELAVPLLNLGLLVLVGWVRPLVASPPRLTALLLVWSALDLGIAAELLRPVEFQESQSRVGQSPVLGELSSRGPQRVAGSLGNLPMLVGAAPLSNAGIPDFSRYWDPETGVATEWSESYSTVPGLARWWDWGGRLGWSGRWFDSNDLEFMRLSDVRFVAWGYGSMLPREGARLRRVRAVSDPWLSALVFGPGVLKVPDGSDWTLWEPDPSVRTARAWVFPLSDPPAPGSDPREFRWIPTGLEMIRQAEPVSDVLVEGERVRVSGTTGSPALLVSSDLDYPGWEAELTQGGACHRVPIVPAFGGWRAVYLATAGPYQVTFSYRPASFRIGSRISLGALLLWSICLLAAVTRNGLEFLRKGQKVTTI